jgi:hypothetical protein
MVENLGFHLKRNFVVRAGHPKNSAVRVPKKGSACRRGTEETYGSRFWCGCSLRGACLKRLP